MNHVTSFASVPDMLQYFSQHKGQITKAQIPQSPALLVTVPSGGSTAVPGVGLVLFLKNGQSVIVDKRGAEIVLNYGILNRQAVPIEFM
jgi:hypothetical protein